MGHPSRDGWTNLRILALFELRWQIAFVSLVLVVVLLGTLYLMPGIRGRVFVGCIFVTAVPDTHQLHPLDLSGGHSYAQIFPSGQLFDAFAGFFEAISCLF